MVRTGGTVVRVSTTLTTLSVHRYCEVLILQAAYAMCLLKEPWQPAQTNLPVPLPPTPPSLWHTQTHTPSPFLLLEWKEVRVERRRTVKASCPERARTRTYRVRAHTHTILMHARPPSINKLHQMLSANSPCKRERALHHGSAVSSQGWQLHKKAWNNLPGFFLQALKTNKVRYERNKIQKKHK